MTLTVHHSHRAELLAERLADLLAQPTASIFAPDAVVVHSRGLERWLAMQLASRLGICANVRFPFPDQLVSEVLAAALGPQIDPSAFGGDGLVWAIRAGLDELSDADALAPIRAYLDAGGPEEGQRRLQGLAHRIAAVFGRYATYRPELVQTWLSGEGEGWEPPLWRAAAERLGGSDIASLTGQLEARLSDGDVDLSGLPGRIALFSVSTLPPLYVRIFAALARHREVHVLLLHPSPVWWDRVAEQGTIAAQHPLLSSMGRLAGDMQVALEKVDGAVFEKDATAIVADSLLHELQADIHADTIVERTFDPDDRSVAVHACHGPMRQVQVLRDVLLSLFDELPDLEPRDVVVMAPDIERYAPLVDAVFSDGETWARRAEHPGGLPRIRFRLADRGVRSENPVAEALLTILSIATGRLPASAVLDLLAMDAVRLRFGIDASELPDVRAWVTGSGVRWARDAEHRARVGQPATDEYTWRFGLRRMLLGQALLDPDAQALGVSPWGEVEGRDERELLGRVVDFAETLFSIIDGLEGTRSLDAWRERLFAVLDALVGTAPAEAWQLHRVRDGLSVLTAEATRVGFEAPVDLAAILVALEDRFGSREPGAGYLSGAVTFCQLVPMRSLPFRVVCLLGMDDGEFPRIGARPGFDRMARVHEAGDRSARDDDRALFLEALLSARDRLVIMTTGRDPRDDRRRPPAVPVCELLDVIDATYGKHGGRPVSEHLTHEHPLSPFSPRAFDGRYGFDSRMRDAASAARSGLIEPVDPPAFLPDLLPAQPDDLEVDIGLLIKFWQHPMGFLCERRLGLWLRDNEDPVQDREPLELDHLELWALRDTILRGLLEGAVDQDEDESDAFERVRRAGRLPLGTPGAVLYKGISEEAQAIAARVSALREGRAPGPQVDVSFETEGVRLTGAVGDLYGDRRVAMQAGKVHPKAELAAWITHLALAAAGTAATSHLVGHGGEAAFSPIDPELAREYLGRLLELYVSGQRAPLPFFPSASKGFAQGLIAGDEWDARRRARKAWDSYDEPGVLGKLVLGDVFPYEVNQAFAHPMPHSVEELARAVWEPALAHRGAGT